MQAYKIYSSGKPGTLDLCTTGIAYIIGIYRYEIEAKHFVSTDVSLTGFGEKLYLKKCVDYLNVYMSTILMVLTQHKPWCFTIGLQNEIIHNELSNGSNVGSL